MNREQGTVGRGQAAPHRKLKVWGKAHQLTLSIFWATTAFPEEDLYGLIGHFRRAAVTTLANIIEGSKRKPQSEFRHFLNLSLVSNEEVKCLLLLATELRYMPQESFEKVSLLTDEVGKMLHELMIGRNHP